jgi:biotin carboxyl carrier protein
VTFKVVVSPGAGRLRLLPPQRFENGAEWVEEGQAVARIEQGRGEVVLRAPVGGRVAAVLGLEGEPVAAGHPVMAIDPRS